MAGLRREDDEHGVVTSRVSTWVRTATRTKQVCETVELAADDIRAHQQS